jgi:hypothetical protein
MPVSKNRKNHKQKVAKRKELLVQERNIVKKQIFKLQEEYQNKLKEQKEAELNEVNSNNEIK